MCFHCSYVHWLVKVGAFLFIAKVKSLIMSVLYLK
uniref:Uncharacterized protein n=1 Tax=Siphoviridae sp. ctJe739 TaxID=2826241 RepID=A0A8S5N765_9CAUD|nr:MAG TPA: hypothetical protein [Siphoviridae sp. ctJe739]